jgi:hypothetical protein
VQGEVSGDVKGAGGRIAIPAGSAATIVIRQMGKTGPRSTVELGLYSVNILGRQYALSNGRTAAATVRFSEDAGKGPTHSSVHLQYGYGLDFRLDSTVQLR